MPVPHARPGRPRSYEFTPVDGFANRDAAYLVSGLDELQERLYDVIRDLPPEALAFVPAGGTNSIAMLCTHMAWAEATWVCSVMRRDVPEEIRQLLKGGSQDSTGELPARDDATDAVRLVDAAKKVRDAITKTLLPPVVDIDAEVVAGARTLSVRGVLLNQLWHWTYHTGQVGMLRRLSGARYNWTYGDRIAPRGPGRDS